MEGDHRKDLPSCEGHGPENCDPYCSKCYRLLRDKYDATLLQLDELKKKLVVGGMPIPGLICVAEKPFIESLERLTALEAQLQEAKTEKRKCVAGCMDRHFCNAPKLHEGGCHCKLDS